MKAQRTMDLLARRLSLQPLPRGRAAAYGAANEEGEGEEGTEVRTLAFRGTSSIMAVSAGMALEGGVGGVTVARFMLAM